MPRFAQKEPLTTDERRLLLLQLQEAEARGIALPSKAQEILNKEKTKWPIASNGYFIRSDGKLYIPSENHRAFIASPASFTMLYGPRGCGKSGAGSQKALFKIKQGLSGAVMNPDFANFKISTWPEFKNWLPWNLVVPSQRHRQREDWEPHEPFTMVFINGVKVYCKGLKDADSARGPNINWLWYDEGGRDLTGLAWKIAIASVRIGDNPQAWVTETPKGFEHWSTKFFINKEIPQDALDEFAKTAGDDKILVDVFHATRDDNRGNLDASFYANLMAAYPSGWLRAREVDGVIADEGGKIGDSAWFKDKILSQPPETPTKKVRFWDLAATEKKTAKDDPDETIGSLVSEFMLKEKGDTESRNFCIEHQVAGWWSWEKLLDAIADTARHDGPYITIVLEEEPGSGGKNQVAAVQAHFKRFPELASHKIVGQRAREVGDRVMAANPWFSLASQGKMWLVKGTWNDKFLAQLDGFTQIEHDDRVTSVTGAMVYLNPFKQWKKIPFVTL